MSQEPEPGEREGSAERGRLNEQHEQAAQASKHAPKMLHEALNEGSDDAYHVGQHHASGHHHRRGLAVLLPDFHRHHHEHSTHCGHDEQPQSHEQYNHHEHTMAQVLKPNINMVHELIGEVAAQTEHQAEHQAAHDASHGKPVNMPATPTAAMQAILDVPEDFSDASAADMPSIDTPSDMTDVVAIATARYAPTKPAQSAKSAAPEPTVHSAHTAMPNIVFIGNPNVGKSTMFNAILGTHASVMNAPGTTVLVEQGELTHTPDHRVWNLVDTPGTASLGAVSPDELVAAKAAIGWQDYPQPDVLVAVIDAMSMSRSLYLISQIVDLGTPMVVAVTMQDLASKQGIHLNLSRLSQELNAPVCVVDGRTGSGTDKLLEAIAHQLHRPRLPKPATQQLTSAAAPHAATRSALHAPHPWQQWQDVDDWVQRTSAARFDWVAELMRRIDDGGRATLVRTTLSDRLDALLLHPVIGTVIFLVMMFGVFQATTALAAPLIDFFDTTLRAWLTQGIDSLFSAIGGDGALEAWPHALVVDGLLDGCITVGTFIPPMGIMFIILSILEDSGYLARAAFVMDRAMRLIGLDGRAFLPLVVGFGCNLPALAATRTLPDSRQRVLTGMLIPFTSCSARLSVYLVLAYAFFEQYAGLVIFAMYVLSIAIVLLVGLILRRTQFRALAKQPFVMGLPSYQMPKLPQLLKSVGLRLWGFIAGAASIIITMTVIMWFLSAIPIAAASDGSHNSFAHVDSVEHSIYGAVATGIAPVFEPAGFNDWHASAALITGFVAKEVVVGSMSQSYAVSNPLDESSDADNVEAPAEGSDTHAVNQPRAERRSLSAALRESFTRSSHGHTRAAAAAFMVFVLAYTPCLATVAELKRQFGMRRALQSVGLGLIVAYVGAVLVFQVGVLL